MDGLNLLFLLFIYVIGGLAILGLLFLFVGIINKNNNQIIDGIKGLSIPIGLVVVYCLYFCWSEFALKKPTMQELVGKYKLTDLVKLELDKSLYEECRLIINSDTTYSFIAPPLGIKKETGKLEYNKTSYALTFHSLDGMRFKTGYLDRHTDGFSIRLDFGGEDSRKSIYFDKIIK